MPNMKLGMFRLHLRSSASKQWRRRFNTFKTLYPPAPLVGAHGCGSRFRSLVTALVFCCLLLWSLVTGLVFCCLLSVVLLTFVKWSVFEDQQSVLFT